MGRVFSLFAVLVLVSLPVAAQQQGPIINPRTPPPPPPADNPPQAPTIQTGPPATTLDSPSVLVKPAQPAAPPPDLPATVQIASGTRLGVILDTPLSTRIAHKGQKITFHLEDAYRLSDLVEIPPETEFTGTVVETKKPGSFGKPGVLRVKLDGIRLANGPEKDITARLDSPDMKGDGRLTSDRQRTTDLYRLTMYTLEGTLIGAGIHGGKGAGIGAGAGVLAAILIAAAHKGPDLYLEPGMPFTVILDQPVELPGKQVYDAQQEYAAAHPAASRNSRERESNGDAGRPQLKRRPHNP